MFIRVACIETINHIKEWETKRKIEELEEKVNYLLETKNGK